MIPIRFHLGGQLTAEVMRRCDSLGVMPSSLDVALLDEMCEKASALAHLDLYDAIRVLHEEYLDTKSANIHLSVIFQVKPPQISKIIHDPLRGSRSVGRPRLLSEMEEEAVIERIQEQQDHGQCHSVATTTAWINHELLPRGRSLS